MGEGPGIVTLVGAGPGDPGLITCAGRKALERAEVVVYDYLVNARLLENAPATALRIFAGKRKGQHGVPQSAINDLLVEHAHAGRRVVRLKGGDPYVFGRGAEEAEHLQAHGIPFRIIPGVTAGVGVATYAGVPITHRACSSAVVLVTGHDDPQDPASSVDWPGLARFRGTIVLYMGSSRLASISAALIEAGKDPATPAALVQWGTLPRQKTVTATLAELPQRVEASGVGAPALVLIGEVVARRRQLAWYESLPLFSRRIVVTRPRDEFEPSAEMLEALGAEVLSAPTVAILPVEDPGPVDQVLRDLSSFDWLVFTSANGVRHFLDRLTRIGLDARALGGVQLAAIGPGTARALGEYHLRADLVPADHRSEGLAHDVAERVQGGRVLLARADRGRDVLQRELAQIADVVQVAVYRNVDADALPDEVVQRLAEGDIDWVTLTSSAITRRLHELLPPDIRGAVGKRVRFASISPVTSEAARELGWNVQAEAEVFTWEGLVAALLASETRLGEQDPGVV